MQNNSPSILFISVMNGAAWGGSEIQWLHAAIYGKSIGYNVTCMVYYWKEKEAILQKAKETGVKIIYIPNTGKPKKNIAQRLFYEWIIKPYQTIFITKFNFRNYDYVYVNQGGFSEVSGPPWKNVFKKFKNYSLGFHNYEEAFVFAPKRKLILQQWIKKAQQVFFASYTIKDVIEKQINLPEITNYSIIKNPITIERSKTYTKYSPLENGMYKIVMLAYLDVRRKAQDNLIKAFATFCKNKNCQLHVYGGGKDFGMLSNLIDQLQLSDRVFLHGHTNNVTEVLTQAHIVTQLTHIDAMPITVVEAMSLSRPILITPVGDMPYWIKDMQNGYIAKDSSINEMINGLEKAWLNKEQWETMGKNAFDAFDKLYPKDVNAYFYTTFIK